MDRHDFLKNACKLAHIREAIPKITWKDGGVLHTWLNLTPERSRNNFKMELSHQKYENIRDFLKDYFDIVEKTALQSEAARAYAITTGIKMSSQFNSNNLQQNQQDNRKPIDMRSPNYQLNNAKDQRSTQQKFHLMEEEEIELQPNGLTNSLEIARIFSSSK